MEINTNKFLNPEQILFGAGLSMGQTVVDLGAGSGFYATAAAKLTGDTGNIYVVDVMDSALDHVSAEARLRGYRSIKTIRADLEKDDVSEVPTGCADMVVLANVIHQLNNRKSLFALAYRMLKTGGKLVVVDWNTFPSPIGPSISSRVDEGEVSQTAAHSSFKPAGKLTTDKYHYGLVYIK